MKTSDGLGIKQCNFEQSYKSYIINVIEKTSNSS